jgi:MFS family permease
MMLGLVSLMADVALEGTKSIMGTYLMILGASAVTVSLVAGLAELIGYGLRVLFGWFVDETRRYWAFILIGYGINIFAVPALALAGSWEAAMVLLMLERVGRAMRCPARDAMISHAGESVGRGWGFGVQEALSSVGGMIGPLIIVAVLLFGGDHRTGFGVLLIPCLLTMIVLAYAKKIEPSKSKDMRSCSSEAARRAPFPRPFWLFLAAGALIAAGYADFPLISYHISSVTGVSDRWIPIMYALAMASNALSALLFGRMYDKVGMMPLVGMAVVVPFFTPLVFSSDIAAVAAGMLLYGVGFGAQESVMRAVIADLAPSCRRGTAFGCYNAAFGASWFLGSAVVGILYDTSWSAMVLLSMGLQFAAIPLFVAVMRERPKSLEPGRRRSGAAVTAPVPPSGSMGEDLVFVCQALPAPEGAHAAEEGASLPSGVPGHVATSEGGTSIGADLSSAAK